MAQGKSTRIAAIALVALALGLAWHLFPSTTPANANNQPVASHQVTPVTKAASQTPAPGQTASPSAQAEATPPTKLAERKEALTIHDLEKYGITVNADHVGKNSATGKVRISTKEGAVLEADQAKMSPNGMLVAEGNAVMVHGEQRMKMAGENAAMAIYFDEVKQSVIVRAASADKVTKPSSDGDETTDPDRNGTR